MDFDDDDDDGYHPRHEWDDDTTPDCLSCGLCEACIDRSTAAADEAEDAGQVEFPTHDLGGEGGGA